MVIDYSVTSNTKCLTRNYSATPSSVFHWHPAQQRRAFHRPGLQWVFVERKQRGVGENHLHSVFFTDAFFFYPDLDLYSPPASFSSCQAPSSPFLQGPPFISLSPWVPQPWSTPVWLSEWLLAFLLSPLRSVYLEHCRCWVHPKTFLWPHYLLA